MPNTPRLDRLSALLAGLAPRMQVSRAPADVSSLAVAADATPCLYLHLLAEGEMRLELPASTGQALSAPCIVICRADTPHTLSAASPAAFRHLMCARAWLEGPVAPLLLGEFAEARVVSLLGAESSLGHLLNLIAAELEAPRCGQPALLDRAGDILFIGLLRHLIAHPTTTGGLLNGLADPRIARALVAIHARPQDKWTLETLALEAGMSRTAFANTFREVMRQTPGKYLSAVRLAIARRNVQAGNGLKMAARQAGYDNASALSRALARQAALHDAAPQGVSPGPA